MTDKQNYFTYTDNTTDNNDKTMENLHKQIIIDGVDVSWCEHYTGNIGYLTDKNWTCRAKIQGTKCEDWSNCYFKNWKRKEQECEELKREIDIRSCANIELSLEFKKYKKAIDEIEEIADNNYEIAEMEQIFLIIGGLDV